MSGLTHAEFEQIVHEEATQVARLENVSIDDWVVSFQVRARRMSWDASVRFDPITTHATITAMYRAAVVPRIFADRVQQRMHVALTQG